jgi:dihydroflavonol-4-reductase
MTNKRIVLVTGATGFVGRHLVERLLQEKDLAVRCLVRPDSDTTALHALGGDISFCEGDVTEPDSLTEAFDGAWGVVNLAGYRDFWARDREHYYKLNHLGADNVFRAALSAGVAKAVQVSTPLAYGVPRDKPFNENSAAGVHPSDYGRSKHLGDCAAWQLHSEAGLPLTAVYLAAVIGAGDDRATMEVRRAVERRLPALVGADTTFTYVYVRDAAEAIARALLQEDTIGQRYLIGTERATTREYFRKIARIADVPAPSRNIPERWLFPMAQGMEWLSQYTGARPILPLDLLKTSAAGSLLFDGSLAERELAMSYTPLERALEEAVQEIQSA